jgi:imidazoleglycerol-phosphate dehydratase/histidinol-phosphatase
VTQKRKVLFIDRDGTLIREPPDEQVDSLDKLHFETDVIISLLQLRDFGFEFVMVTNQDGLGTASFPQASFDGPHQLMINVFESQGIRFSAVHVDPSRPEDHSPNRKPATGMVLEYLKSGELDLPNCYVIGDRQTDMELARNMGIAGLRLGPDHLSWPQIARQIIARPRVGTVSRTTSETSIQAMVELDRGQLPDDEIKTGIGFFDHMLEQIAKHGGFALQLRCRGDLHVDPHHTIEDVALAIGSAIDEALGDRRGIGRYGFLLAMDESQANVAIDLSGRPVYVQRGKFTTNRIGEFPTEMVPHFFQSLSQTLRAAIQIEFRGDNNHHMCEAVFKGLGRALRPALARSGSELPSTKGVL